jgi:hypothetical protein
MALDCCDKPKQNGRKSHGARDCEAAIPLQKSDRPTSCFLLHFRTKRTTPKEFRIFGREICNHAGFRGLYAYKDAYRETAS